MDARTKLRIAALGVAGALLATGCSSPPDVTVAAVDASPSPPAGTESEVTPTSPRPTPQQPAAYPTESWWSDDPEELATALDGCETGSGPFREQECFFIGLMGISSEGQLGLLGEEHGVDLVAAGYDLCRQLDRHPELDTFREHLQAPPSWPEPGDDWPAANEDMMLALLTLTAGQTLCPHHTQLVASFWTPEGDG